MIFALNLTQRLSILLGCATILVAGCSESEPEPKPEPRFNANDINETTRWIASIQDELYRAKENPAKHGGLLDEARDKLAKFEGTKVNWFFRVGSFGGGTIRDYFAIIYPWNIENRVGTLGRTRETIIGFNTGTNLSQIVGAEPSYTWRVTSGEDISVEYFKTLKEGSIVKVTATITNTSIAGEGILSSGEEVWIKLESPSIIEPDVED